MRWQRRAAPWGAEGGDAEAACPFVGVAGGARDEDEKDG